MIWKSFVFVLLAVGALAQAELPEVTDELRNQIRTSLRDVCTKNGGGDKLDDVENSVQSFINCTKALINIKTLNDEIEEAKPNGALDEVFKKYCAKSPQLKTCIRSLVTGFTPCVPSETRQYIPGINNSTDQLIDFVCYKDGDRIALFIAEKGPECFKEKSGDIRQCAENIKSSVDTVEKAKSLTLKEQCAKFDTLSNCIVTALSNCETPTPGNMAESLLRYVKNGGPCKEK